MKATSIIFACLCGPLLSACTTESWYDVMQEAARDKCNQSTDIDRTACLNRNRDSYDTYKKKREEVVSGSKKE